MCALVYNSVEPTQVYSDHTTHWNRWSGWGVVLTTFILTCIVYFRYEIINQLKMSEAPIITCTAPVNIAVIKYCKNNGDKIVCQYYYVLNSRGEEG